MDTRSNGGLIIRSSSKVVNMGPKTSWMKQLTKRSETKAMKDFEREMKDAVQKKREVSL